MAWKWFVKQGERVDGPFTTDNVLHQLTSGTVNKHDLIWGPGTEEWQNLANWQRGLNSLGKEQPPDYAGEEAWHYAIDGQSKGPFSREQLIAQLKPLSGQIMVWTKGMKEWAPLYEFHDLLTELGINKRQFPRADLSGKAILKGNGNTLIAPLLSISEGGFGISLDGGLVAGEGMSVELQSPSFREALQAKAEVRYVGQGVIGMKFTQINAEAAGAIIQFIKSQQIRFPMKAA